MAQRRCLVCGSTSPGGGKRAHWNRHPATGEEWLCGPCQRRIHHQLKPQHRQQAGAKTETTEEQQQPEHSSGEADAGEGEQAPTTQPLPVSRKRRQEGEEAEDEAAIFHGGPAAAAKRRADGKQQPAAGSGGTRAAAGLLRQQEMAQGAAVGGNASPPAAKRWQRRKQTQPQRLLPQKQQQQPSPVRQPSLAPTDLVEGAVQAAGSGGPGASSLHGVPASAGEAAVAEVVEAAAAAALPGNQQPAAGQDLFDLLQQAMEVAAAAAAGLTPELVAAFAMLLPLRNSGQVG